jgi:hypothetical protein
MCYYTDDWTGGRGKGNHGFTLIVFTHTAKNGGKTFSIFFLLTLNRFGIGLFLLTIQASYLKLNSRFDF